MCDELLAPNNGHVILTDDVIATYSCDNGYQLIGDEIRTCEDGEWTGQEPTCIRMSLPHIACKIIISILYLFFQSCVMSYLMVESYGLKGHIIVMMATN